MIANHIRRTALRTGNHLHANAIAQRTLSNALSYHLANEFAVQTFFMNANPRNFSTVAPIVPNMEQEDTSKAQYRVLGKDLIERIKKDFKVSAQK
jgi:hypothetical protein